jgi:hypothetical protein
VSFGGNTVNGPFYGSQPQRVGPMPPPMPQPSWPQPNYGPRIDGLARQLNMLNQVLMRIEGKVDQVLDKDQDNAGYPMQPGDPLALGPQKVPETKEEVNDILAKAAATKRAYEEMEEERMLERGPTIFNPPFKANPHRTQWHPNEDFNPKTWEELVAGVKEARQRITEQDENLKAIKRSTAMDVQHSSDMREGIRKDQLDIERNLAALTNELARDKNRIGTVEMALAGIIPRVAKLERLGDEMDVRSQQDSKTLVSILGRLHALETMVGKMNTSAVRFSGPKIETMRGDKLTTIPEPLAKEQELRARLREIEGGIRRNPSQNEAKIEDGSEAGIEGKSP